MGWAYYEKSHLSSTVYCALALANKLGRNQYNAYQIVEECDASHGRGRALLAGMRCGRSPSGAPTALIVTAAIVLVGLVTIIVYALRRGGRRSDSDRASSYEMQPFLKKNA